MNIQPSLGEPLVLLYGYTDPERRLIRDALSDISISTCLATALPSKRSNQDRPVLAALVPDKHAIANLYANASRILKEPLQAPIALASVRDIPRCTSGPAHTRHSETVDPSAAVAQAVHRAVYAGIRHEHIPLTRSAPLRLATHPLSPDAMRLWLQRMQFYFKSQPRSVSTSIVLTILASADPVLSRKDFQTLALSVRRNVRAQDVVAIAPPSSIMVMSLVDCEQHEWFTLTNRLQRATCLAPPRVSRNLQYGSIRGTVPDTILRAAISLLPPRGASLC